MYHWKIKWKSLKNNQNHWKRIQLMSAPIVLSLLKVLIFQNLDLNLGKNVKILINKLLWLIHLIKNK